MIFHELTPTALNFNRLRLMKVALGLLAVSMCAFTERRAEIENLPMPELFKLALAGVGLLPRLQEAERIARGCKVVRPKGIDSPQGGAEWRITVYAPPREQPMPDPEDIAPESDEWEEAS